MKTITNKGFTMVELLVVIIIVGCMAAISLPALLTWFPEYRLKSASRELYDNLQWARMSAIKSRQDCYIDFNSPEDNLYSIKLDLETLKTVDLADYSSAVIFTETPTRVSFQSNGLANTTTDIKISNSDNTYKTTVYISGAIKLAKD